MSTARARRCAGIRFGNGVPMGVGQFLARLDGDVLLATLARKAASGKIAGWRRQRYNNTLRGPASLPIAIHPATH